MYKSKLDSSVIDKGFLIIHDSKKNYLCCNLFKFNRDIITELKEEKINKFTIEKSCEISDFNFLADFKQLKEVIISFTHKVCDISSFNELKELQVLGVPQFVGFFNNQSVENLGFVWSKEEDFAENLRNLKTVSIQKCDNFQSFIDKFHNNENLKTIVFTNSTFSSSPCKYAMNCVEEVELQYCNVSSLEPIINTFPNCKSLLLSNTKKINNYSELNKLKKLESLSICSSAPIKDVHFISELCMLNTLKIVSTNIESNSTIKDLSCVPNFTFYQTGIDKLLLKNRK